MWPGSPDSLQFLSWTRGFSQGLLLSVEGVARTLSKSLSWAVLRGSRRGFLREGRATWQSWVLVPPGSHLAPDLFH